MQRDFRSKIHWQHPKVDVTVVVHYERGTRDEPAYMEIEKIYANGVFPERDISNLFNLDRLEDDFWDQRPDLGDY
jgi:hypothetical protein